MTDWKVKILKVKESALADNDADAEKLRMENAERGICYYNLMSSPGSGKTTLLKGTIRKLRDQMRIGIMEADIDSDVDAEAIAKLGIPAIQVHTGGMCHLDADMSRQGLRELPLDSLDVVILENVGNLVCPAEFDTGAWKNLVILSVPEGDDKPLKYPLMFEKADAVIVNKIDSMDAFDFDCDRVKRNIAMRNPDVPVFFVSAETGEGMEKWCDWLKQDWEQWKKGVLHE
ncbi:MAG: hydrogenase nickel incorporation protein HypB [Bulleidia sp.]